MKPILENIPQLAHSSLSVENISLPHFISAWHFHPVTEIILITKSTGTGFIGDSIVPFTPGTIAMIGENLPHVWLNGETYYQGSENLRAEAIVLKFNSGFLGTTFLSLAEARVLKSVFLDALRGMVFFGKTCKTMERQIHKINTSQGFERIIVLLQILNTISASVEYKHLASQGYSLSFNTASSKKISEICEYIMLNFKKQISLKEMAEMAHMTTNSFCRFFRKSFLKTFKEFLNEVRIGHACKLLIEKEETVYNAAFQSGFHNLSNFHRQFKAFKGMTPNEFQNHYKLNNFSKNLPD